ncbi:cell division protein FtsQ/DivIB [Sagittula sp. NFXS13]|uniref:cell division protein FtsQ/DivIB n=1 Tax=Sagittula sp. NFXS13 TaxID=2819095 RepID=UPI0032E0559D
MRQVIRNERDLEVTPEPSNDDMPDMGMARLDPTASRLKYRLERLMLTPIFRFALRVALPIAVVVGGVSAWFSVENNREAFNLMVADVRAAVESRPEFQVKLMAIDGASEPVAELIRAELPYNFPISSFDVDLSEMQARIGALDPIRSVEVRIRQGGVLQIDVDERKPAVLWRTADGLRLLDEAGVLVGPANSRGDRPDLPVIAGEASEDAVAQALRLWSVSGPIQMRLRGFERIGARRWDVVLDRDQRIMLPEKQPVQALERVIAMAMAPQVDLLARDLTVVDLRLPRRPVIRMTDQATQQMWRIKLIEAGLGTGN